MTSEPSKDERPQSPLISRSSILILGGILFGVTWSEAFANGLDSPRFVAFMAALVALLAFVVLNLLGQQRRERVAHQEAIQRLEQRVNRHLVEDA
jgi:uncharacterized membrane protein YdjX (TVP38/TMEM64 family)